MPPAGVYLENELLQSQAVKEIKSAKTFKVLLEFYRRRIMRKPKDRRCKHSKAVILNNGEIVLRYSDAKKLLGIPQTTYSRCLTELVELGFLDIAEMACGLHRQPTKFSISERWKKYGTPDFDNVKRERIKPPFAQPKKKPVTTDGQ